MEDELAGEFVEAVHRCAARARPREAMQADLFLHGLWQFRAGTGNFAWAGNDMALADLCGRACGEPLHRLLGGLRRSEVSYFYYLARGDDADSVANNAKRTAAARPLSSLIASSHGPRSGNCACDALFRAKR